MGVYNKIHVVHPCRSCGNEGERTLQIKYGACYLHDLRLGDSIPWEQGQGWIYGKPIEGRGWIPAYSDRCPDCGDESSCADFAVILDGGVIAEPVQAPIGLCFREDVDDLGVFLLGPNQHP